MSPDIKEAWSGPGKKDGAISILKPKDDALHIDMDARGNAEWWYFDAKLENGYMVVGFFRAKHERTGKTGVEITVYTPSGEKIQNITNYSHAELIASKEYPDVRIGPNYVKVENFDQKLLTYEVFMEEEGYGFHLTFNSIVQGWIPGSGYTEFDKYGHFGWCVPIPRAKVEGYILVNGEKIAAKGIGYHDHNWLSFNLARFVKYWYWGRAYSETYTIIYAYIRCNKKMDNYPIRVLMVAENEEIIHSTGEFEFNDEKFIYSQSAGNSYPQKLEFKIENVLHLTLDVEEILDADNLLFEFNPLLRFLIKYLLRLKPGYFRLKSKFILEVAKGNKKIKDIGETLHEMVVLK